MCDFVNDEERSYLKADVGQLQRFVARTPSSKGEHRSIHRSHRSSSNIKKVHGENISQSH